MREREIERLADLRARRHASFKVKLGLLIYALTTFGSIFGPMRNWPALGAMSITAFLIWFHIRRHRRVEQRRYQQFMKELLAIESPSKAKATASEGDKRGWMSGT